MSIPAHRDINLLDVEGALSYGLAGEACVSFELRPEKDLRMCESSEHEPFVGNFARLLEGLPQNYGLLFEAEVSGACENARNAEVEPSDASTASSVLERIEDERRRLFEKRDRTVRVLAHVWSGVQSPLRLPLLPPFLPSAKTRRAAHSEGKESATLIEDVARTLQASLQSMDVGSVRLGREEILKRYWEILSPMKADIVPARFSKEYSLRSQLVASNAREEMDYFFLDGTYQAALSFYDFPEELALGAVDALLEVLPVGSRYVQGILVPEQEAFLERLKRQHRRAGGLISEASSKDFESEARISDIDEIITRCRQGDDRIYVVWSGVILRNEKLQDLIDAKKRVLFAIREIFGITALCEDLLHRRTLLASLPMNAHLSPRRHLMMGSTACALAPLSRPWRGTKEGMVLSSPSRERLRFDLFDGGSPRHGIICATTGGGKSFSAVMMILSLISDPRVRAMVIDSGHSYRRASEILGGAYFDIRIDERFAVNPLLPRNAVMREDGTIDPETLGAQVSLLLRIAQASSGPSRFVMEKALQKAYQEKDEPLLSDIAAVLKNGQWDARVKSAAHEMANELLPFAEGIYSVLLSRPSRVRAFETPLTVFELSGLKEHPLLQSVLVAVIQFTLARQLQDKAVRKVMFIDEGWKFFKDASAQELIESSYREMRKYNGAIISISQSPAEFLESAIAPAIMSNIHWAMVLKMASGHERLREFGFSDQAIDRARGLQVVPRAYSEVLIRFGQAPARIARIAPTSLQYWIATTNAEEAVAEQRLREEKNLTPLEAVETMAVRAPVLGW